MNAAEYGQLLALALVNRVVSTNTASRVFRPLRNPNCSGPSIPLSSAMAVILLHILTVMSLRMLEGTVIGLYWAGCRESPPYDGYYKYDDRYLLKSTNLVYQHTFPYIQILGDTTILYYSVEECLQIQFEFEARVFQKLIWYLVIP